jgi:hypothetical protein
MIMRTALICNQILGRKVEVTRSKTAQLSNTAKYNAGKVKEELAIHEEGEVMQTVPGEEEAAEGIVLDYLGYNTPRSEWNYTEPHTSVLLSKSRNPLLVRSMRNLLTSIYVMTEALLDHQTNGLPMR